MAAGVDRLMKSHIGGVVGIGGIFPRPDFAIVMKSAQRLLFRGGHPAGGEAGAQPLEMGHDLEHFQHSLGAQLRHHRALARALENQAAGGELQQRLADGGAGNLKTVGQARLVQPGAWRQGRSQNFLFQLLSYAICESHSKFP